MTLEGELVSPKAQSWNLDSTGSFSQRPTCSVGRPPLKAPARSTRVILGISRSRDRCLKATAVRSPAPRRSGRTRQTMAPGRGE
jgi:hypothetical protein